MSESGRVSSPDVLVPIPRTLLRDVATYLYNHGEDVLRMALEECDDAVIAPASLKSDLVSEPLASQAD